MLDMILALTNRYQREYKTFTYVRNILSREIENTMRGTQILKRLVFVALFYGQTFLDLYNLYEFFNNNNLVYSGLLLIILILERLVFLLYSPYEFRYFSILYLDQALSLLS